MLGEAAWRVILTAGPLRAFFARVRARRGPQVAATATARKLVVLFWHLLTRQEDYAFARPGMTRNKSSSAISAPVNRSRRSAAIASIRRASVRLATTTGADERSSSPAGPSSR